MEKTDHRKLGKKLGIFHISEKVGIGLPLWLPKGATVRKLLMDYLECEQRSAGYDFVATPHLGKLELYKTSGHWDTYRQYMYQPIKIDQEEFILKPMNCPHHIAIYESEPRSWRDLPIRLAEYGTVYRSEKTGELLGLIRTRGFTIDDAHIFMAEEDLEQEFQKVLELTQKVFNKFKFNDFRARVGLRDKEKTKYVGADDLWEKSEQAIENVMKKSSITYEKVKGEAAFYGPKLDFLVKDNLGREWQLGTIQVDYNLPERFDLKYIDKNGKPARPVMIHRAPFGSLERFIAILLEHFNGKLPLWLSPVQVAIIPVSEKFNQEAIEFSEKLVKNGSRVKIFLANETVSKKVLVAKQQSIPLIIVFGEKEIKTGKFIVVNGQNKKKTLTEKQLIEIIELDNRFLPE
ncbi:MAG: threonyl-tRNA synthetase [Candidatus Berkelbacteria bacterium Licking1014_7]|uniref:Threonine--tRNA ligase n=1 Tax=Candidatus Berkelbacteria bacterium Licking1014_7 TaxID=2017147 RepID=A0A554LKH2_9BACT|nr:MAG: threonyl-tRNA synthetase [Candidatus Berkelbacteria bacterium Licking1014_7]